MHRDTADALKADRLDHFPPRLRLARQAERAGAVERYAQRVARIVVYDLLLLADAVSEDGKGAS